jgi:hypothetical protein
MKHLRDGRRGTKMSNRTRIGDRKWMIFFACCRTRAEFFQCNPPIARAWAEGENT